MNKLGAFSQWDVLTSHPTPVIEFTLPELNLLAKVEYLQPGGSVKRRIGRALLEEMLSSGEITDKTEFIVEATAGNTAIALAEGIRELDLSLKVVAVVKEKISKRKIARMKEFGVIPHLISCELASNPVHGDDPFIMAMKEVCKEYPNSVEAGQFFREANPRSHEFSTGVEIINQLQEPPDAIILGCGTGGTLTGVARAIRKEGWKTKIVLADPVGSIIGPTWLGQVQIAQSTIVEGIGHDVIPPLLDMNLIDDVVMVPDKDTIQASSELAALGFSVGLSSAVSWVAARNWAKKQIKRPTCLVLFADHGSSYIKEEN
ncbi:TPA: pyridoxal-phosphate dependent enzyme [Bacillus tropicus]|nr:pyridoxal-phosphate dependent enzyme [Bacillus tropicus]